MALVVTRSISCCDFDERQKGNLDHAVYQHVRVFNLFDPAKITG